MQFDCIEIDQPNVTKNQITNDWSHWVLKTTAIEKKWKINCVKIRIHDLLSSAIHLVHSNFENSIKNKRALKIKDYIKNTKKPSKFYV